MPAGIEPGPARRVKRTPGPEALLGGELAASRVQAHWDLELPGGSKVQVKYLANPAGRWVNEHTVRRPAGEVQQYALVLFEAFAVVGVVVMPLAGLPESMRHCASSTRAPRMSSSSPSGTGRPSALIQGGFTSSG
ncbi:hypothetical protein [Actinoplanes flavus]|uniref:Uncharacterized protein n=1 Tax=Actinoplanes flavus TaxID=2820290 RepID=A0ABS3UP86_9ACTN|nr:hypothetical protein [Actinoplanes flavus]MBO3739487.1 hypothetical protein [Actinoplanes flavus]